MASPTPQISRSSFVSVSILVVLVLLAIDALHLQLSRISYSSLIAPLLNPHDGRLRKVFTGFGLIDHFLSVILTMFMPIFTGEKPELTVFTAYFAGQVPSHLALMVVEGMREGKARGLRITVVWLVLLQVLGYGVAMPLYYILDLMLSSHNTPDLQIRSPSKLQQKVFIPAIVLGYILPSALQLLPVSQDLHQIFLATWQPFPIYFLFVLWILSTLGPNLQNTPKTDRKSIRRLYNTITALGSLIHWVTILAIFFRSQIFSPITAERLSFHNVFIPHAVRWYGPCSISEASMQFLQWDMYLGALAGLVWAASLAKRAGAWEFGVKGVGCVVGDMVVVGMPCAAVRLLLRRDAEIMG